MTRAAVPGREGRSAVDGMLDNRHHSYLRACRNSRIEGATSSEAPSDLATSGRQEMSSGPRLVVTSR